MGTLNTEASRLLRARFMRVAMVTAMVTLGTATCSTPQLIEEPAPAAAEAVELLSVIDGDTIAIQRDGQRERVRIIGIDTPELGRDGASDECYAQEATTLLERIVAGGEIEMRADESQGDTDRYGRLLRHLYIDDISVAVQLIAAGAGYEYTYDKPYLGQDEHRAAEAAAIAADAGLWGAC